MNPYIIGGAAALIAILGLMLNSSVKRNGELEALLETQVLETQECADANQTNDETITKLEASIAKLSALRRSEAEERERVLAERERELLRARARADRLEEERENEQETNDDCAALTALDVGTFCPATARQLRERSRGPGGNGDTDG